MSVGQHTLYVLADNFNSVGEGSETNNVTAINFTVTGPSLPFNISVAYSGNSAYQSYFYAGRPAMAAGDNDGFVRRVQFALRLNR